MNKSELLALTGEHMCFLLYGKNMKAMDGDEPKERGPSAGFGKHSVCTFLWLTHTLS